MCLILVLLPGSGPVFERLEVLGAIAASVRPPLLGPDVGSEVGSVPREIDLAFRSWSDSRAVGSLLAGNAEDSVG